MGVIADAGEHPPVRAAGAGRALWIGIACSGLFLFLAVRKVDWAQTGHALREADWRLLALGVLALVGTFALFAVRSTVLLRHAIPLRVRDAFSYILIGYLANTVLPLRLGDVARAVLVGREQRASRTLVLSSVVLERVLDIMTLLVVALALAGTVDMPSLVQAGLVAAAAAGLVAMALLLAIARSGDAVLARLLRVPLAAHWLPSGRLRIMGARFADGLQALRSPRQFALAAALSGLAWLVCGAATAVFVAAFHLGAPWYAGLFVLVVINLGAAIPSSPGFVGVYHFLAVLALSVWVPDKSAALAYAIGTHGLNLLLNVLLGLAALAREGISVRSIGRLGAVTAVDS